MISLNANIALTPEYVAALVEQATRQASAERKAINRRRYKRRYARIAQSIKTTNNKRK